MRTRPGPAINNPGTDMIAMLVVGIFVGVFWLIGCGGGDSTAPSPPAFSYNGSQPFPAVVGEVIALTPAVSGPIDAYAVSP